MQPTELFVGYATLPSALEILTILPPLGSSSAPHLLLTFLHQHLPDHRPLTQVHAPQIHNLHPIPRRKTQVRSLDPWLARHACTVHRVLDAPELCNPGGDHGLDLRLGGGDGLDGQVSISGFSFLRRAVVSCRPEVLMSARAQARPMLDVGGHFEGEGGRGRWETATVVKRVDGGSEFRSRGLERWHIPLIVHSVLY